MGVIGKILKEALSPITGIVSEVVVDKDKRDEINLKIRELVDKADERYHEELMGQIDVNKTEAQHPSVFVAGWRPFIGWVGGVGLGYNFVLAPFVELVSRNYGYIGDMPQPDTGQLMTLILAMLGVGAMRSYDKVKGTATDRILPKD